MENGLQIVDPKWRKVFKEKQDMAPQTTGLNKRQSSSYPDISLIFIIAFLTSILKLMAIFTLSPKPRLENHPMCGVTTGGRVSQPYVIHWPAYMEGEGDKPP